MSEEGRCRGSATNLSNQTSQTHRSTHIVTSPATKLRPSPESPPASQQFLCRKLHASSHPGQIHTLTAQCAQLQNTRSGNSSMSSRGYTTLPALPPVTAASVMQNVGEVQRHSDSRPVPLRQNCSKHSSDIQLQPATSPRDRSPWVLRGKVCPK